MVDLIDSYLLMLACLCIVGLVTIFVMTLAICAVSFIVSKLIGKSILRYLHDSASEIIRDMVWLFGLCFITLIVGTLVVVVLFWLYGVM